MTFDDFWRYSKVAGSFRPIRLLLVVRGGKASGVRWRARSALEAGVTMR
jgi:hypothetical protein